MIEVRNAQEADIRAIHAIETECSSEPWSMGQLTVELHQDFAHLIVAEEDGEILGFADFHVVADDAHLNEIGVRSDRRRKGAAALLMEEMIRVCETEKCVIMSLEVRAGNGPALALYRKYGFAPAGVRKRFYRDPVEDGITMIRTIEV